MKLITLFCTLACINITGCNQINIQRDTKMQHEQKFYTLSSNQQVPEFEVNYIQQYKATPTYLNLNVKINTSNLNLSNLFYFISCYGPLCAYCALKWKYNFEVDYQNTSDSAFLNLNDLTYNNNYGQSLNLNQIFNLESTLSEFVNNFFENSTCKLPTLLIQTCQDYSMVNNLLTLNNNFQWMNPGLTFSSYQNVKLFQVSNNINFNQWLNELTLPVSKNSLFLDINTSNLSKTYTLSVPIEQLNRYFVNITDTTNSTVQYGNSTNAPITLNIQNSVDDYYILNPNLLLVQTPVTLLNNNEPYTTLPTLQFNVNNTLLNNLFDANIAAQLCDILISHFNNTTLTTLLNQLWSNNLFSMSLIQSILNLIPEWNYNPSNNDLTLDISSNFNINNLLNVLNLGLNAKSSNTSWISALDELAGTNLALSQEQYIELYQALLSTYQGAKFNLYFQTKNTSIEQSISYSDLSILLTNNLLYEVTLPYEDVFLINKATISINNQVETLNNLDETIKLIKYPEFITPNMNQNAYLTYDNNKFLLLQQVDLSSNSTIFANLQNLLNLSSTATTSLITTYNANYTNSTWLKQQIIAQNNFYVILKLAIIFAIYNLWNENESLLDFLNSNNFNDDLFLQTDNALITNITINPNNLTNNGTFTINFDLNNFINATSFFNNQIFKTSSIDYNNVFSLINTNICSNQSMLEQSKTSTQPLNHNEPKTNISNKKVNNAKNKNNINYVYLYFLIPLILIILVIIFIILKHKWKTKMMIKKYKKNKH